MGARVLRVRCVGPGADSHIRRAGHAIFLIIPPALFRGEIHIMRAAFLASLALATAAAGLAAQSPFEFREAYLLEHRIEVTRSGEEYDPGHSEQGLALEGPGPADQDIPDRNDPAIYRSGRWQDLLNDTDRFRRMGGLELAEKQYLDMAARLRQAQGPASSDLALLLDHIGEYYLELREFDKAYKEFSDALEVRKASIAALPPALTDANGRPALPLAVYRLHYADLEARLGQMDLAKGDLESANRRLTDAVSIFNEKFYLAFVGGLYAVYFDSLTLERQQNWQQAEELWRNAVELRKPLIAGDPYWNALKEQAAFYARRGDFHAAAQIAEQVKEGTAGRRLRSEFAMPYLESRPRAAGNQPQYSLYTLESNIAMSEILAMDKWRTSGPDEAAPLLEDLVQRDNREALDHGSDAERTELLKWYEQRAFLHMSILLDGNPPPNRIEEAYTALAQLKGRYMATLSQDTRHFESERGNPGVDVKEFAILDQLAQAREDQAHDFLATALDGRPYDAAHFAADENKVRILTSALLSGMNGYTEGFELKALVKMLPAGSAYLDFVQWTRTDRDPSVAPHHEYGVFVVRTDAPIRYIRLGEAEAIDNAIDAVHAGVLASRVRGIQAERTQQATPPEVVEKRLANLYQAILAPVEPALAGATLLYIVPDGKLTVAPFSAFVDAQGHYLFENRTLTYLGSWRDLVDWNYYGEVVHRSPAAIAANPDFNLELMGRAPLPPDSHRPQFRPLPGTEAEAADVARDLSVSPDHVLVGDAARKGIVQSLQSPDVLHLATHSIPNLGWTPPAPKYTMFEFPQPTDTQFPLLDSVIAFAGANRPQKGTEDGLLTGLEVESLHLPGTRLVVLSSCESAQGSAVDGAGVLGLRAAFAMAGAQAIVMTLWPVDDQAGKQFMDFFYAHLDKGASQAIRLAQRDMLATPNYKNPFYWSGYVVSETPDREQTAKNSVIPPTPPVSSLAPGQTLVNPNCYEFHSKSAPKGAWVNASDIRVKIGGIVMASQPSPNEMVFNLSPPGNELDEHNSTSVSGQAPIPDPDVYVATQMHWTVEVIIDQNKDSSSLSVRYGSAKSEASERRLIQLTGPPSLFHTFALPRELPPLGSYTTATVTEGSDVETIDQAGTCTSAP
jgi:CHAT domain-containing protein